MLALAACGNGNSAPAGVTEPPPTANGDESPAQTDLPETTPPIAPPKNETKGDDREPLKTSPNSSPVILTQPEDVTVTEGEPIRFFIKASGNEVLHYEWTIEKGSYTDTFSVDAPELHLTDSAMVSQHDGAKVYCRVITEDGFADTRKALIRVNAKEQNGGTTEGGDHPSIRARDYDVPVLIANLPRSDATDSVWAILRGYWTAADNLFVAFDLKDGIPGAEYGVWEAGGSGFGAFAGADPMGEYTAGLIIRFPATQANEVTDAKPETDVIVFIDLGGLEQDGKIRIKIESHGDGDWHTYAYGGRTGR